MVYMVFLNGQYTVTSPMVYLNGQYTVTRPQRHKSFEYILKEILNSNIRVREWWIWKYL
jgi:hypothetical protein